MLQNLKQRRNEEGGFTLIELLIVIVILGILAAIVVFAIGNSRSDAVQNSCKTNQSAVQLSAEAVKTKTGAYPTTAVNAAAPGDLTNAANGGLLKSFPVSTDYALQWNTTNNSVDVFKSANANGTPLSSATALTNGCSGL
jgi:general secretion pathway protein G